MQTEIGKRKSRIAILALILLVSSGCLAAVGPTEAPISPTPVLNPIRSVTDIPPSPAPTATVIPLKDYAPVEAELTEYLTDRVYEWGFDLGVAFVDIQTGQVISVMGDRRYHAMSSFKGPLAVRYFQMLESGETQETPDDQKNLELMLRVSYNQSTTCFFEHTGGVPAFNDWLAELGFDRTNNFIFRWDEWACPQAIDRSVDLIDYRYFRGDEALGLPNQGQLLKCIEPQLPCDKAFTPVDLAEFYARLYRGEFISDEHLEDLLLILERRKDESVFWIDLPDDTPMQVFTKGGTHEATGEYRVHFFSEAGIIVTEKGAFAVAMFMQRQPEWPGTFPMAHAFRIFYDAFMAMDE